MMRNIALTAILLALATLPLAYGQSNTLLHAYGAVYRLGSEGGNVTALVDELNYAINLTRMGMVKNATEVAYNVLGQVPALERSLFISKVISITVDLASASAIIALATLAYVKRKAIIGYLLLKLRGGAFVKAGPGKPRTLLFNEEALAVIAAIALVVAIFITAQGIVAEEAVRFSAIALLGPSGKLGGYPSSVPLGSQVNLYVYVYNDMGGPIWYVVRVYLVNSSYIAQPPLNLTPLLTFERILPNNQSWIFPLGFVVNKTGSYRLVAELWMYSPINYTLMYTGRFVQLYFNVTKVG